MFVTTPSFEAPAATFPPTVSSGSGRTFWIETTSEGAERRPQLDLRADDVAGDDLVADGDDGSVDRCVDVRSCDGADVERAERPPGELVPREAALRRARDPAPESREQPFVSLRADRLQLERALGASVKADRRDATLRHGGLDAKVPDRGEHLRVRRRGGHRQRRGPADGGWGALAVERGQRERCDGEHGDHGRNREAPRAGLRSPTISP